MARFIDIGEPPRPPAEPLAPPPPEPEGSIALRLVDPAGRLVAALDIGSDDHVTIEIEHGLADITTDDDDGTVTFMLIPEE